jgi:hypothetical protein
MRRRDFLAASAATAGGVLLPRRANAAWGDAPPDAESILLQPGVRAERCLEMFLYGGMGSFESFYVVPEYGTSDDPDPTLRNTQWHLFAEDHASVFKECGFGPSSGWLTPFATDSLGMMVNLGPIATAFKERQDILDRMRVIVMSHDFQPHEAALPFAMTGLRLGNPRMAGTGAHVQRYWLDQDTTGRLVPFSWVLSPTGDVPTYNTHTATEVGMHPGSARPLQLVTSGSMDLGALLGRREVGDDASRVDPLMMYYRDRAAARYVDPRGGAALRSRTISDHQFALRSVVNAPLLQAVLDPALFVPPAEQSCGTNHSSDPSGMTIGAAVGLLTHPSTPAKFVSVIDGGIDFFGGLAYDTHSTHLQTHSSNLSHVLKNVAGRINGVGENDPAKLNIDDTMILICAEFGRTPYEQYAGSGGTNHFPYGYVNIVIGGPVLPGVTGAIGPDGFAVSYLTPSEVRAGLLAGLGIYPFAPEAFAVGDLQGATNELDGLVYLHQQVLGRSS